MAKLLLYPFDSHLAFTGPLSSFFSELVQGGHLLCLWPKSIANPLGTNSSNTGGSSAVLLQVSWHIQNFSISYFIVYLILIGSGRNEFIHLWVLANYFFNCVKC
jgi:hypothetical protein